MTFAKDVALVVFLMERCFELDNAGLGILMDAVDVVKPGLAGGRPLSMDMRAKLESLKSKVRE